MCSGRVEEEGEEVKKRRLNRHNTGAMHNSRDVKKAAVWSVAAFRFHYITSFLL